MKNSGIEDIFIGNSVEQTKKSKKGIIIVFFIILMFLLIGVVCAYLYFSNQILTEKQNFINSISNTNIKSFFENDIYSGIIDRMSKENSESETTIKMSTTEENQDEELQSIDLSDFELILTNQNNIEETKSFGELKINYSGNELFKARVLTTKDAIALASDEIVDRYVGIHYDKMKDCLGIDFNQEQFDELSESEQISLTDEEKKSYLEKYVGKFFENIGEDKFSSQENIALEKDNNTINVVSYKLALGQEEYKTAVKSVLTELRNDQELLSKLVSSNSNNEEESDTSEENVVSNDETDSNEENTVVPSFESEATMNLDDETNSAETTIEVEENNYNSSTTFEVSSNTGKDPLESLETGITSIDSAEANEELVYLILGKKVNMTVSELQDKIDSIIETVDSSTGNGIEITVYVNVDTNTTEKISTILPDGESADIEFTTNANDNTIKITFLQNTTSSESGMAEENSTNEVRTYSAEDDLTNTNINNNSENTKDGFTMTLNKVSADSTSTLKLSIEIIEKAEINEKYSIEIKTNGNSSSNNITNDVVLTVNTDESEYNLTLDNKIEFAVSPEIEDLTDDNCLFIENLSEEEVSTFMQSVLERAMVVYQEKLESLNIINTNTNSPIVDSPTITNRVTKDEAKEALIQRVSNMMGEAQMNGEEFTIQNLVDLTIEGYEVSSTVTEEAAIIVVDTYTFRIDSNFNLTEVE